MHQGIGCDRVRHEVARALDQLSTVPDPQQRLALAEEARRTLIEWSNAPGLLPRVRYGPDRGKEWREIEEESLVKFLTDRDPDVRFTAETELARRRGGGSVGRYTAQELLL